MHTTLYHVLHDPSTSYLPDLTYVRRLRLLRGIASAVEFLHLQVRSLFDFYCLFTCFKHHCQTIFFFSSYCCVQGIIHHDIKSLNVLVDDLLSIAKLSDFGEAKLKGLNTTKCQLEATLRGVSGTVLYQAPEIVNGDFAESSRVSEMYSFGGKLVWECLVRKRPQLGTPEVPSSPPISEKLSPPETQAWMTMHAIAASCLSHDRTARLTSSQALQAMNAGLSLGGAPPPALSWKNPCSPRGHWKLGYVIMSALAIIVIVATAVPLATRESPPTAAPSLPPESLPPTATLAPVQAPVPNPSYAPSAFPTFTWLTRAPTREPTRSPTREPTPAPTRSPTPRPTQVNFTIILPEYSLQSISENPWSPQSLASDWITSEPSFDSLTSPELLQLFALATFYYSTGGGDWEGDSGWLDPSVSPCSWTSLFCSGGKVTSLSFLKEGLSGPIPPEIGILTALRRITLKDGALVGQIPEQIGWLPELQMLDLESNRLTGTIPESVGQLTKLTDLDFELNELTGKIPTTIGNLSDLQILDFERNKLSGSIPSEVSLVQSVRYMSLQGNELSGQIPSPITQLSKLTYLDLRKNNFSGTVPSGIENLAALQFLWLDVNGLAGQIPSSITQLSQLTTLDLGSNKLTGEIPPDIFNLTGLISLNIRSNMLNGTIPDFRALSKLEFLGIGFNSFTATRQAFERLMVMPNLVFLNLSNLNFTGTLPLSVGLMSKLEYLSLQQGSLQGTLPTELSLLSNLQVLDFSGNDFSGTIPLGLGRLTSNHSTSNLWIDTAHPVGYFDFTGNPRLTGNVPAEVCALKSKRGSQFVVYANCTHTPCSCCPCTSPFG